MTEDRALQLIAESLNTLKKEGVLEKDVILTPEFILIGMESPLDSIGFVAFITDLEEKIFEETKQDLYLVLNEITEFNVSKPFLSSNVLAKYIVKISKGE